MPPGEESTGHKQATFDFVVVGSGFGGSVSAMRLAEKGYSVLVLERGKRYRDDDFPRTNWDLRKYLWLPAARCYGIQQLTLLNGVMVLHGSGVGGGSLIYANVLMEPDEHLFEAPSWHDLADWKTVLRPHYDMARRMLGATANPQLWPADHVLRSIGDEMGWGETFRRTEVGVFFGEPGREGQAVPDPYFEGQGPERAGCDQCGGCMVGCRRNAKNDLPKNYLYFAEKWGAEIRPEAEVTDIRPLSGGPDGARYEVFYRRSTAGLSRKAYRVRARGVVVAAGVLGTLKLLLRCRDVTRSLPDLSSRLGEMVRTNSEALLGSTARGRATDYSKGVAITSVLRVDNVTHVEPVRYPAGSSFMRLLALPLVDSGESVAVRLLSVLGQIARRPLDFLITHVLPGWPRRTTILLVMQVEDNVMRLRLGRNLFTLFRRALVSERDKTRPVQARIDAGHRVTRAFAGKTDGIPGGSITESAFNVPMTAHILGGCPIGRDLASGVVDINCQVFNHPGLYVVDGSIMPANPGINPSLTISALAEYAMSRIPPKS